MIIFKCFFKKNTTKIYIGLLVIFLLGIILLKGFSNNYTNTYNSYYKDSYIYFFSSKNDYNKLKKINKIKKIEETPVLKNQNDYFSINKANLKDNEIIISSSLASIRHLNIGSSIKFLNNNESYEFKIIDIDSDLDFNKIYIKDSIYNDLINKTNTVQYKIYLNDYIKLDKTMNKIKNNLNVIDGISVFDNAKQVENILIIIYILNIFLIIFLIVFLIFYVLTLLNIFKDEEKSNNLLKTLGYSNKKISFINNLKFLLMLSLSIIISLLISIIVILILKKTNINIDLDMFYILKFIIILIIISFIYNMVRRKEV